MPTRWLRHIRFYHYDYATPLLRHAAMLYIRADCFRCRARWFIALLRYDAEVIALLRCWWLFAIFSFSSEFLIFSFHYVTPLFRFFLSYITPFSLRHFSAFAVYGHYAIMLMMLPLSLSLSFSPFHRHWVITLMPFRYIDIIWWLSLLLFLSIFSSFLLISFIFSPFDFFSRQISSRL